MKYPTPEGKTHSHPTEQNPGRLTGKMRGRLGGEDLHLVEYRDFVIKPSTWSSLARSGGVSAELQGHRAGLERLPCPVGEIYETERKEVEHDSIP